MKKIILLAIAGMMAGAVFASAQFPPMGGGMPPMGGMQMPEGMEMPKILTPEEKTADMAQKYDLTEEQQTALLALNQKYDGKLEFRMNQEEGERPDIRKMSDEERQAYFNKMMEQMGDMQQKQAEIEKNQKAYEEELKNIFDKKQLRKYRTDLRRAEAERQAAMQRGMGGMGFPGGGFPGGGFPGGGFPGGF